MPPRSKVTKDMIVQAAVEVVRQKGFENVNARTVAGQLHCSTQPVMYHFATIDSLKRAAYSEADRMHTEYLTSIPREQDPILAAMQEGTGLDTKRTKDVFLTVALFAHGYASIIANNALEYDEALIAEHLERAWDGAMLAAAKEDMR